tara:strand:+ start:1033 stop:1425 length:393 start_codon:yes stop_codon:yes gene_type:complete
MIQARVIIEIMGSPKEHVEKAMETVVDKFKKEDNVKVIKEDISKIAEVKQFWSTFVEFEIEIENIARLFDICFDYMPSSIEILEPEKVDLESEYTTDLLNDLLAKLHRYDMLVKNLNAQNFVLKKKLNIK